MGLTDRDCVERCRSGRPEAFRELVLRYQRPVLGYVSGRTGNRDMAEEAAQEAFVRAFCTLHKLKDPGAFYPWLLGIARHVSQELNRSKARHWEHLDAARLPCPDSDPAEDYDVRRAIAQLPPACQKVVLLRYYGRLSCQEVADRLQLSIGSVTKTLSRAHVRLRQLLEAADGEGPPTD